MAKGQLRLFYGGGDGREGARRNGGAGGVRVEEIVARAEQGQPHRAEIRLLSQRPARASRFIAENDVIHADIAPGARFLIDDLQPGLASLPGADVETAGGHEVAIFAGGAGYHPAVDDKVDTGLAWVVAAADEVVEVVAFDGEFAAGERAGVGVGLVHVFAVAGIVSVNQPGAMRSDFALVRGHFIPGHGAIAKGRAGGFPAFIGGLFEIIEENIVAFDFANGGGDQLGAAFQKGVAAPERDPIPAASQSGLGRI